MMKQLTSIVCRILFIASFVLAGVAAFEKLVNLAGYTLLRGRNPWGVLEFASVALLFVIALQLREVKTFLSARDSK
jgi:hypothetical protein